MGLKGIIMAGGKGTRLRPITYSIPKPLIPIAGRPCISYAMDSFYEANVKDFIITTGYKFESLITGVLDSKHPDQNVIFSVEKEAAGTAGSVKLVENFINDTFIVGSGDVLQDFNIKEIIDFHREKKARMTIVLTTVPDPSQFGIVEVKDDKIVRFLEKPSPEEAFSNLVNSGLYVAEPEILEQIPSGRPYDFAKELFPKMLKNNEDIYAVQGNGVWIDTGRPQDLILANTLMVERYGNQVNSSSISGKMILNARPRMGPGSQIQGPSYIGESVKIGSSTKIKGTSIYDGTEIGNNVEIEDSVIMDSVKIADGTKVYRSVIMSSNNISENCEINDSVLSQHISLQKDSRIFNVLLHSGNPDEE